MRTRTILMVLTLFVFTFTIPVLAQGPAADKPTWNVGDAWRYDYKVYGSDYWAKHEYAGTVEKDGKTLHLVKTRFWRLYYSDSELGFAALEHVKRGRINGYEPAFPNFRWPLAVGKKWTERITHSGISSANTYFSHADEWAFEVEAYERVKTRAGEFDAFRIRARQTNNHETQDSMNDKEYWYAPAAKNIVKYELSGPRYNEEGELTKFTLADK